MDHLVSFLHTYGLSQKEVDVYLACLQLGEGSVATIARRAGTKRPGTYLILEDLIKRGLVDTQQTQRGITYHALNPQKISTNLQSLQTEFQSVLPELTSLYRNKKHKPVVSVYEQYAAYDRIADEVRDYVQTGKEALYFGNSEFFFHKKSKVDLWFRVMKNKRTKCREIICGDGATQREYIERVKALKNPNYQVRQIKKPPYPVLSEFGIWKDNVYFFSGSGKELYTIVIEHTTLAHTQRTVFESIWNSLPKP